MSRREEYWHLMGQRDGWKAYSRMSCTWGRVNARDFKLVPNMPMLIVPDRDIVAHEVDVDCPCQPQNFLTGDGSVVVHHNAWDGRRHSLHREVSRAPDTP